MRLGRSSLEAETVWQQAAPTAKRVAYLSLFLLSLYMYLLLYLLLGAW